MTVQVIENKVDVNQIPYYLGLVGGQPKTGKTTQCARWSEQGKDGVLLVDVDMGASLVDCNRLPVTSLFPPTKVVRDKDGETKEIIPPKKRDYIYKAGDKKGQAMPVYSFQEVYSFIQDKIVSNNFPYDTIVIDTVDALNEMIEQRVMKELGIDGMGQAGYGQDWNSAKEKNMKLLGKFFELTEKYGINVLLICHTKQRSQMEDGTIQESPSLPRGFSSLLQGHMTWICNVKRDKEGQPIADFKSYSEKQVGSRIKALNDISVLFNYESFKKAIKEYEEE